MAGFIVQIRRLVAETRECLGRGAPDEDRTALEWKLYRLSACVHGAFEPFNPPLEGSLEQLDRALFQGYVSSAEVFLQVIQLALDALSVRDRSVLDPAEELLEQGRADLERADSERLALEQRLREQQDWGRA
ncbi:MAG: hypothetical protein HY319_25480 [Armatimonadetes bacterium]|nr:hypothetical protein [Armatimonadota bacterium]